MNEVYNYEESMKSRIELWIEDNIGKEEFDFTDIDDMYERCYDDMFISDDITGNASGSFFFNAWKAEEAICHNWNLLEEALSEFGCEEVNVIEKGPEWCDVTIRCYLLSTYLQEVLEEMYE